MDEPDNVNFVEPVEPDNAEPEEAVEAGFCTRVYRYGLRPPTENAALVRDQMRLAREYRWVLTTIERGRRAAVRALHGAHGHVGQLEEALRAADELCVALSRAVSVVRSEACSRAVPADLKTQLDAAKEARKTARAALAEYRRVIREDPHVRVEEARINDLASDLHKNARAHSGLYWGTYLVVEAAVDAAKKTPLYDGLAPRDPAFPKRDGSGVVAVQIQGGLAVEDLRAGGAVVDGIALPQPWPAAWRARDVRQSAAEGDDTRFRIAPVAGDAYDRPSTDTLGEADRAARLVHPPVGWGCTLPAVERRARWLARPEDERLRDPRPRDGTDLGAPAPGKRLGRLSTAWLRVGSEGRAPVWASWPLVLHRPMPERSVVKWAAVHLERVGRRDVWSLHLTLSVPTMHARRYAAAHRAEREPRGAVGVDVGWRVIGDEVRVCAWHGEDGRSGELRLDARTVAGLHRADELRAVRDDNFNAARSALASVLASWSADVAARVVVPAWLLERAKHLAQWRSPARLAYLVRHWATNRFPGDHAVMGRWPTEADHRAGCGYRPCIASDFGTGLLGWLKQDEHLRAWECNQRVGALRHRKEVYRRFAATLASEYAVVVLEEFDLRKMARRKPAGEDQGENERARANRHLVAVSELRDAIVGATVSRGGEVVREPAQDTTRECPYCHRVEVFDAAASVDHKCGKCGVVRDQDDGAGQNLIARLAARLAARRRASGTVTSAPPAGELDECERVGDAQLDGPALGGSKWSRAKKAKAARPIA